MLGSWPQEVSDSPVIGAYLVNKVGPFSSLVVVF